MSLVGIGIITCAANLSKVRCLWWDLVAPIAHQKSWIDNRRSIKFALLESYMKLCLEISNQARLYCPRELEYVIPGYNLSKESNWLVPATTIRCLCHRTMLQKWIYFNNVKMLLLLFYYLSLSLSHFFVKPIESRCKSRSLFFAWQQNISALIFAQDTDYSSLI